MNDMEGMSDGLTALRRFTRVQAPMERCELCGAALDGEHPHLLERASRKVACACPACALLFYGQEGGRFLRVPRRVVRLPDFAFSDAEWEEMALPIGLAFFVRREDGHVAALYPSPAGVIESSVSLERCAERLASDPILAAMEAEVEALVVNRVGAEHTYLVLPIDECYRMTGLIRTKWRGLSGGPEIWVAVAGFFAEMRAKAAGRSQVRYA